MADDQKTPKKSPRLSKTGPKRQGHARTKANRERLKAEFVEALSKIGVIGYAAREVGISRQSTENWRREDPDFAEAVKHALDDAVEVMEREAFRRAAGGTGKPITGAGQREVIRDYSDVLLIFLLKANRPEKYRERYEHQPSGPAGGPIQVQEMMRAASAELDRQDREEKR